MRCPWCGSTELVWDSDRGDVICVRCGSVVDRIYVSMPPRRIESAANFNPPSCRADLSKATRCAHLSRLTKEYLRVMEHVKSKKRLKDVVIDSTRLGEFVRDGSHHVKILKRKPEVISNAVRNEYVRLALSAMAAFPRLYSRTDRAKIALAMLALALASGRVVNVREIAEDSGLSPTHVRRLKKLLSKETDYVSSVRKVLAGLKDH